MIAYVWSFTRLTDYSVGMTITQEGQREPLTFLNAPTVTRDGIRYVDSDAARELVRRLAARDAELLARLAAE